MSAAILILLLVPVPVPVFDCLLFNFLQPEVFSHAPPGQYCWLSMSIQVCYRDTIYPSGSRSKARSIRPNTMDSEIEPHNTATEACRGTKIRHG